MSETVTRRRRSLPALAACLAVSALILGACGGGGSKNAGASKNAPATAAKSRVTVNIASFSFNPATVRVKKGGSITFVNRDRAPHTAQTDAGARGSFDSGRLDLGKKKTIRYTKPGRYSYYCIYHRFMTGTVEVAG